MLTETFNEPLILIIKFSLWFVAHEVKRNKTVSFLEGKGINFSSARSAPAVGRCFYQVTPDALILLWSSCWQWWLSAFITSEEYVTSEDEEVTLKPGSRIQLVNIPKWAGNTETARRPDHWGFVIYGHHKWRPHHAWIVCAGSRVSSAEQQTILKWPPFAFTSPSPHVYRIIIFNGRYPGDLTQIRPDTFS